MARDPLSRSWTQEQDAQLIVLFSQNASWVRMSVKLNRTRAAIRTRAWKLGLTVPAPQLTDCRPARSSDSLILMQQERGVL